MGTLRLYIVGSLQGLCNDIFRRSRILRDQYHSFFPFFFILLGCIQKFLESSFLVTPLNIILGISALL